jgi:uncharacterized protein (TIGR03086 family)
MIDLLQQAIARNKEIIGNIDDAQLSGSTPCPDFDVKKLVNHLIGANLMMSMAADGQRVEGEAPTDLIGSDPLASYSSTTDTTVKKFSEDGALERIFPLPFAEIPGQFALGIITMENLVHGWDLAKATGQSPTIPENLAKPIYEMASGMVNDDLRGEGKPFGSAVKVSNDATSSDKLVAWLGRQP